MTGRPIRRRDERGWRVPLPGTASYHIYELMVAGKTRREIYRRLLPTKPSVVNVLIWKIQHPGDANGRSVASYCNRKKENE